MGVHMGVPWLCAPYFLLLEAGRLSPRLSVCQTDVPPLLLTWVFSTSSWASLCLSSLHVCPSNLEGLGSEVWGAAENSHVQQVPRCCCQNLPFPGLTSPAVKLLLNYMSWRLSFLSKIQIMFKKFCSPSCPHLLPLSLLVQSPKFSPWCSERIYFIFIELLCTTWHVGS